MDKCEHVFTTALIETPWQKTTELQQNVKDWWCRSQILSERRPEQCVQKKRTSSWSDTHLTCETRWWSFFLPSWYAMDCFYLNKWLKCHWVSLQQSDPTTCLLLQKNYCNKHKQYYKENVRQNKHKLLGPVGQDVKIKIYFYWTSFISFSMNSPECVPFWITFTWSYPFKHFRQWSLQDGIRLTSHRRSAF